MNNWAIILGASSGIGLECAYRLAKNGINIYGLYLRKKNTEIEKIVNDLKGYNIEVIYKKANASNEDNRINIIEESKSGEPPEECQGVILESLALAIESLQQMKQREGQAMHYDIKDRLVHCDQILNTIEKLSLEEPGLYRERLQDRLAQFNDETILNPERLEQEIALLADRLDISEELLRFRTHLQHMNDILEQREIGKKAEFMMQELNREINTISSKSNQAEISKSSVEIKSQLEKIREQLQNIE